MSKENYFITYNSLISICILSEGYDNSQFAKFLYAEENLENTLNFKTCKKSFLDYTDIKGSLFYIRNSEECNSNYSFSEKQENISKELGFLNKERIQKNKNFYLQHMASKKFISIERTKDNKFILKLMKNINTAANFYLRKSNENRNSREYMNINDVFNLSIYIEDDELFYYVKDDINPIEDNNQSYNIIFEKEPTTNFCLFNQQWFIRETKEIYSGQLINIIFSVDKKEEFMLGVMKKEKKNEELIVDENENKDEIEEKKAKYDEYEIIGIKYTENLDKHVLYNSFWIIEEDSSVLEENKKVPIEIKNPIRIKNFNTGLYLNIRVKGNFELKNNSFDEEYSDILYELYLVDESTLNNNFKFEYNFLFLNCTFGILSSEIMDDGGYILKGVYHKLNLKDIYDYKYYYKPLSLIMNNKNENIIKDDEEDTKEKEEKEDKEDKEDKEEKEGKEDKYRLVVKQEDDFIFKIKKIDLQKGIQVTYVKKIIELQTNFQLTFLKKKINSLEKVISDDTKEDNGIINKSIKFFLEYLLNTDYSFKDEKYESNIPIKERQNILFHFNIVELINKSLEYYLNKIEKEKDNFLNDQTRKTLNEILINIIKFFKNLSLENEEIKEAIYIISLNKLLKLSDIIFQNNITDIATLVNFIFDLMDNSEELQDYFLGGGEILIKKSLENPNLQNYNLNELLREDKLLKYIEKNYNYLLYYEKLIGLNKVQYKREKIESDVKKHIKKVKRDTKNNKETYQQIIDQIISEIIKRIKKHAFLLDKFNDNNKKIEPKATKRKTFKINLKKNSVQLKKEEERYQKEIGEKRRKDRKKRVTTKASSNIILDEIDREDTTHKFLEDEEKENNIESNNKIFLFNETKKPEDDEPNNDNSDRKDNNINLKKTFTLGFNFLKKKNVEPENKTNNKLANLSFLNRIKTEFSKGPDEDKEDKENKKKFNKIIFNSLVKRKSKFLNKSKTGAMERIESIRPGLILSCKDYLIKLGKIVEFIQFFTSLDLNKSLFINEDFNELLNKESGKSGNLDPSLFIFFKGGKIEEGNNCFLNKNIVNFYLFYLYNKFFPNLNSNLREKINLETITGKDIINEIGEDDKNKEDYSDEDDDEVEYQKKMIQEFNSIDDDLCILYSIYQFLINQYIKTIFKLFKLKFNFYLNFLSIGDITKSKNYLSDIIKNLLSKIVFLNQKYFQNLYQAFEKNPSLLNEEFDLDNQLLQNNKNQRRLSIKEILRNKVDKFSRREAMLIEYIYFFLKKCDEIKYLYEKMVIFKYVKNLIDYEKSKTEEENDNEDNNEKLEEEPEKNISIKEKLLNQKL